MTRWSLVLLAACGPDPEACDAYVDDLQTCYDGFCDGDGASSAFCGCWTDGRDLDPETCDCMPLLELEGVCDLVDVDGATFDCEGARDTLGNLCT